MPAPGWKSVNLDQTVFAHFMSLKPRNVSGNAFVENLLCRWEIISRMAPQRIPEAQPVDFSPPMLPKGWVQLTPAISCPKGDAEAIGGLLFGALRGRPKGAKDKHKRTRRRKLPGMSVPVASLVANGVGKLRGGAEGTTEAARLIEAGAAVGVTSRLAASFVPSSPSSPDAEASGYKDFVALTFLGTTHEWRPNEVAA